MTELRITLDDTEVRKKLNQMAGDLNDFKESFRQAGDELLDYFGKMVFESQGKESGEPWRALSATTLKMRDSRSGYYANPPITTNKILIWTGRLKKGFFKTVERTRLTIGNTVDYFKYHQRAIGWPPQRKMLTINSKVIEIVVNAINEYLIKSVKR